jgi:phosphohistidine phosphatase
VRSPSHHRNRPRRQPQAAATESASCDDPAVIWVLRHGDAEDEAADDASRRLTEKGEGQALAAGRALAALGAELDTCLASPKLRAAETARLACASLGLEVEQTEALRGGDVDLDDLTAGRGAVLVVGHEPDLSRAVQRATGARIELKKGGLAALERGTMLVLLRPAEVSEIGSA